MIQFRKSAAKYVSGNVATMHQMKGFVQSVGLVFGWYDNFDLLVSTPNGRCETHAMASHPDTIMTTLIYMQQSLVDMGMTSIHLSIDMQLYRVTKQVCWYHPEQFHNVFVHPGGMHIIQIFIGCIAKLLDWKYMWLLLMEV